MVQATSRLEASSSTSSSKVYACRWGSCRAVYYTYEDTLNHELHHVRFDARRTEREFEEEETMNRRLQASSLGFVNAQNQALERPPSSPPPPQFASLANSPDAEFTFNHIPPSPVFESLIIPRRVRSRSDDAASVSSSTSQDYIESQLTQETGEDDEGKKSRAASLAAIAQSSLHISDPKPLGRVDEESPTLVSPTHHPFESINAQQQVQQSWYSASVPRKPRRTLPSGEKDANHKRRRSTKHGTSKLRQPMEMEVHISGPSTMDLTVAELKTQAPYMSP